MIEILWHGRGGQGAFTAAKLLGAAFSLGGETNYSIAFPSFGPERRGAPIRAFTKLDTKPIGNRSEIGKADYILVLDDTLFTEAALDDLKPEGKIIVNSKRIASSGQIIAIDGDQIAKDILRMPITNTIMLGALTAVAPEITIQQVEQAIEKYMPQKLHEKNKAAARAAKAAAEQEAAK